MVSPLLELVDLDVEQGILQVTEAERALEPINFRDRLTRQLITRVELRENISKVFKSFPPPRTTSQHLTFMFTDTFSGEDQRFLTRW